MSIIKLRKSRHTFNHTFNLMRVCGALCLLLTYVVPGSAQEQSPKRGFNPGVSYAISDIETISTTGGNLLLNVPLGGLPAGRGGMKASVNLVYNSKLWDTFPINVPAPTEDVTGTDSRNETRLRNSDDGGWHYAFKYDLKLETRYLGSETGYCQPDGGAAAVFVYKLFLTLPDGSKHEMHLGGTHTGDDGYTDIMPDGIVRYPPESPCPGTTPEFGTLTYYSGDGTFLRLEVQHDSDPPGWETWENNPWTLYLPDGGRVTGGADDAPQRIYDRNNNYIEVIRTYGDPAYGGHNTVRLRDQVGRSAVVEYNSAPNQDSVHVRGTNNELATTKVLWTNIQVNKSYRAGSPTSRSVATNFRVVSQIILPAQAGGLSYNFSYNAGTASPSHGWGEVSSVTLPSGAKASYQYQGDGANNIRSEHVLVNHPKRKDLVYRREYDGTAVSNTPCDTQTETKCETETTTYGINFDAMGTVAQDGWVTAPDGGTARDYVTPTGDVYKSVRPDGTVIERQWQSNFPSGSLYAINNYVKREFTSIRDAAGNLTKTAIKEYNQDKNGNVTQAKDYDWVTYASVTRDTSGKPNAIPAGAQLKRVTTNSYYYPTPDASNATTNDADAYYNSTAPRVRNAVASSETGNGAQPLSRSEFSYDNAAAPTAGNLTGQKSWDSTKGASTNPANYVSTSTQYNSYGSPILTTDARGTQTEYTYGAVGGHADLYPTIIRAAYGTPLEQVTTLEYDFYIGAVTRSIDPNNVATATTYDALGRPTLVRAAEGIAAKETRTATAYSDTARRVIVRSDLTNAGDAKLVSIQHFDQLGRVRLTRTLENAATESETSETSGVKVQTRYLYSGSESYQLVSNPYRAQYSSQAAGEPSMGWTRSKTNNGGRMLEVQTFGGASLPAPWDNNTNSSGAVTTAYDAEFTTVTDQAGKVRRSMSNGLGQLARVDEPDKDTGSLGSTASPVQPTAYSYDALGNLTQVQQATQTRTFNYSSLSRLTSATNPESGTVGYTYDAGGNLLTKTDARGVTITYSYDALSRNKTADYSDTAVNPDIERFYDGAVGGKGRFWYQFKYGVNSFDFSAEDGYDALGRPYQHRQVFNTNGVSSPGFYTVRTYNRAGATLTQTYPSGHTVSYNYDAAGRLGDNGSDLAFTGNLGDGTARTYAAAIRYDEAGRMTRERFGTQTPLYHKQRYNVRGQKWDVRLSTVDDPDNWNRGMLVNNYGSGDFVTWGTSGANNNGNVLRSHHYVPGDDQLNTWSVNYQDYAYDALNRLSSVSERRLTSAGADAAQFSQVFSYDRWGNRQINAAATTDGLNEKQFAIDTATNRLGVPAGQLGAMTYDLAGNLTDDSYTGAGTRTYDAENRMTSAVIGINSNASYTYDADGRRVRRQTPNETVWQVYGMEGELLAEYAAHAAPSTPQKEYGYRNGELLVTATAGGSGSAGGASATFVKSDTTTQGSWKGVYGAEGYNLAGDGVNYPNYAQVSVTGQQTYTWAASTQDVRALRKSAQGSADRIAATWYSSTNYTFDLNLTDGQEHQVALYCLDWDTNNARAERVEVLDAATNALLGSRDVSAYAGGQYVVWRLRGHVKLKVIYTGAAGANATVSGLFFDAARVNVAAAAQGATASASSVHPYGNYSAASAINGDRKGVNWGAGGGWNDATPGSLPDWLQVDFNGAQTISEINLFTCQDNYGNPSEPTEAQTFSLYGLTGFEVQYWTGSAWAAIPTGSVTGNNRVWRKFVFPALTTQKIRILTASSISNDGYSRIIEVEAYQSMTSAANDAVQWLVTDHLGTPRLVADLSGSLSGLTRHDYLPFGEEVGAGTGGRTSAQGYRGGDGVRQHFTGKERDIETSLDYFGARYYASVHGRFTSVDPIKMKRARMLDPQRINLYGYCRNNPLKYIDPDGADLILAQNLKPQQQDYIINNLARLYMTKKGREGLERADQSPFNVVITEGKLPRKKSSSAQPGEMKSTLGGSEHVTGGNTNYDRATDKNSKGSVLAASGPPGAETFNPITVTINKDNVSDMDKDPAKVFAHEILGHTNAVLDLAERPNPTSPAFDITGLDKKKDEINAVDAEDVGDIPDTPSPEAIKAVEELLKPRKKEQP